MDTIQREEKAEVARREPSYCFLLETFERVRDDMRSGLESMKALVSSLYFLVFSLATRVISIGVSLVVESNSFIFFKTFDLSLRRRYAFLGVQRTCGKFGTCCILFSVFENVFFQSLEFSAGSGAKPSHQRL